HPARRVELPVLAVQFGPVHPYQWPVVAADLTVSTVRAAEWALRLSPEAQRVEVLHSVHAPHGLASPEFGAPEPKDLEVRAELEERDRQRLTRALAPLARAEMPPVVLSLGPAPLQAQLVERLQRNVVDLLVLGRPAIPGLGRRHRAHLAEKWLYEAP